MGTSVLDGRPTPAADIYRFIGCTLTVQCTGCGHGGDFSIAELVAVYRFPRPTPIWRVGQRLRCHECGAKGTVKGVKGWRR